MTHLDVLRELTESLVPFPRVNGYEESGARYQIGPEGKALSKLVFRDQDRIAVHDFWFRSDTRFPEHSHAEKEYAFVYRGTAVLHKENKDIILKSGDMEYTAPGETHSAYFPEECKAIVISIPATKDYPDAP